MRVDGGLQGNLRMARLLPELAGLGWGTSCLKPSEGVSHIQGNL